jgi:hypothetical protein
MMAIPSRITAEMTLGYWPPVNEGQPAPSCHSLQWWFEQFARYEAALSRLDVAATTWGSRDKVLDVAKLQASFARDLRRISKERRHIVDAGLRPPSIVSIRMEPRGAVQEAAASPHSPVTWGTATFFHHLPFDLWIEVLPPRCNI